MVPLPSATLHPDIRNGSLPCFWTCKWSNLSSDKKGKRTSVHFISFNKPDIYIQRLTILLSPVMLDSSIASECPEIRMPSAGTWRRSISITVHHRNVSYKIQREKNRTADLITNIERYNITNNDVINWDLNSTATPNDLFIQ